MRCLRKQANKLSITSVFVTLTSTRLLMEKQHLDSLYANKTNLETFSKNYRKTAVPDNHEELLFHTAVLSVRLRAKSKHGCSIILGVI